MTYPPTILTSEYLTENKTDSILSLFYELMIDSYVHCLTSLTISNWKTIYLTCWLHNLHILWVSSPSSDTQAAVVVGQMEGGHIHPPHSEDTVLGGLVYFNWGNYKILQFTDLLFCDLSSYTAHTRQLPHFREECFKNFMTLV